MKANNNAKVEQPVVAMPVASKQEWVINCNKCGAALTVKNDGNAYICPVCGELFRIQTGTRIVKEIAPKEKQVHLTLTEKAVDMIAKNDAKKKKKLAGKKISARKQKRARKKLQRALEMVVAQKVRFNNYDEGDVLVVDLEKEGLVVKTPEA